MPVVETNQKELLKNKKKLTKIFSPMIGHPQDQIPLLLEVMNLYISACDGNGWYNQPMDENEHGVIVCQDQYTLESLEVLENGLKSLMEKYINYPNHDMHVTLKESLKQIRIQRKLYKKKNKYDSSEAVEYD